MLLRYFKNIFLYIKGKVYSQQANKASVRTTFALLLYRMSAAVIPDSKVSLGYN